MNYIQKMRRPSRHIPIVAGVLVLHGFLLWGLLQWHVYTPQKMENLIRVSIYPDTPPKTARPR